MTGSSSSAIRAVFAVTFLSCESTPLLCLARMPAGGVDSSHEQNAKITTMPAATCRYIPYSMHEAASPVGASMAPVGRHCTLPKHDNSLSEMAWHTICRACCNYCLHQPSSRGTEGATAESSGRTLESRFGICTVRCFENVLSKLREVAGVHIVRGEARC